MKKFKEEDKELITSKIKDLYNNQCKFLSVFEESKKFYKKLHISGLVREFERFKKTTIGNYLYMTAAGCTYKNLVNKINEDFDSKEDFIKACDEAEIKLEMIIKSASIKNDIYNHAIVSDLEDKMILEAKKLRDYNNMYGINEEVSYLLDEGLMIFSNSVEEYDVVKCEEALDHIKNINKQLGEFKKESIKENNEEDEFNDLGSNEEEIEEEFDDLGSNEEEKEEETNDLDSEEETHPSITIEDEPEDIKYADTWTPLDYDPKDEDYEEENSNVINEEITKNNNSNGYTYSVGYEPESLYNDDYMNPYTYAIDRKVNYIKNKPVSFDDKVYTIDESLDDNAKMLKAISNLGEALEDYNYYIGVVEDIKKIYSIIKCGKVVMSLTFDQINEYANVVNKENKKAFDKFHGENITTDRNKEQEFISTHLGVNKLDIKKDIISKYEKLLEVYSTTGNYKNLVDKYEYCYDMNPYKYTYYELNNIIIELDNVYISKTKSKKS